MVFRIRIFSCFLELELDLQILAMLGKWCRIGLFVAATPVLAQQAQYDCLDFTDAFGPFDYRTATAEQKLLVEGAHFTRGVESLITPKSSIYFGADIDYTLRAFPNHPRALMAMVRLSAREKREKPNGARYTIDCYFDRALQFAPDDPNVRLVYGIYLLRKDDARGAVQQMEQAQERGLKDPNLDYNLGLAYLELGDYEKSLDHAKRAYAMGYPLPWLRDKLKAGGHWKE